jgi:CRISPR system Cascade subunit CasD
MSTLLLRLAGPMQSWGVQSRFTVRDTGLEPSKSGVIGLLCAALGHPRSESLGDLVALCMAVRVEREGRVERDYHTAGGSHREGGYGVAKAKRGAGRETVVSVRYYLADAEFLVALWHADLELVSRLHAALVRPQWALYLGRKAFPPAVPPPLGIVDEPGEEALRTSPWRARTPRQAEEARQRCRAGAPPRLRLVLESDPGPHAEVRWDVPLSFAQGERSYRPRAIAVDYVTLTETMIQEGW